MLIFVTCVKHPENSHSYAQVWQLLNNTLYSVCSQKDTNFRVIIVCDKKLPLIHHQELINQYTDFVEVDFPSHSEDVLNNFSNLGNFPSAFKDPRWVDVKNEFETSLEYFGKDGPSFLIQLINKFVGQKGIKVLHAIKRRTFASLRGKKLEKDAKERDRFHLANVVLNMGTKLLIGIAAAKKHAPEYIMIFDADDYVGNDVSAYANAHPGENGWIMAHGYQMMGKKVTPYYRWNSVCGTGNIYSYALLMEIVGDEITERSTQNDLFKHVDSEFIITIGRHDRSRKFFEKIGKPFLEYPTRSVIYLVDHDESSEFERKIIRGESDELLLKYAHKFGEVMTIPSTLVGYFNVLPDNSTRVFCLGFQKTGTTSIDWVLQDMGYQVTKAYKQPDAKFSKMLKQGDLTEIKKVAKLFDAFQDIPWFLYYKEFDQWYPKSKFILTTRDSSAWWRSFLRYFRTEYYPLFEQVYGFENPVGNRDALVRQFEQHNEGVKDYFKERPDDLLILDVAEERALEKLTDFLDKKTIYEKMPHKNATLKTPSKNTTNTLKHNLKRLRKIRIGSLLKLVTFSAPQIIVLGCRKSGAEQLLSILSCHPNIHVLGDVKLTSPIHHTLTPEADRRKAHHPTESENPFVAIDKKSLIFNLLKKPILFSSKRWAGMNLLGILAVERLLKQFGNNIRIINVVRDGRDVILENTKKVLGKYIVSPEIWAHDIGAGIEFEDHSQVLTVRYEDLVQYREKTIREVCKFIGETDPAPCLNYPRGATMIEPDYWIGKWKQDQYSDRIAHLMKIPEAVNYLRHYRYIK